MIRRTIALATVALVLSAFSVTEATATAQRTFVASYGNDANPCTLTLPCRGFSAAIAQTGPSGEVIVLDSAGYGPVTITQSVSIIAPDGVFAGITVPAGADGVDVAGADIVVVLRGLTINGQGGNVGISFLQGRALHIDRCTVSNVIGRGISLTPGDEFPAAVYITDTKVDEGGGTYPSRAGIYAEGNVDVSMDRTQVYGFLLYGILARNGPRVAIANSAFAGAAAGGAGIQISSDDGASTTMATISNSTLRDASFGVATGTEGAGSTVIIAVTNVTVSNYASYGVALSGESGNQIAVISDSTMIGNAKQVAGDGIVAFGAGVSATISGNTISGNTQGGVAVIAGALVKTLKNNVIQDNATKIYGGTLTTVAGD